MESFLKQVAKYLYTKHSKSFGDIRIVFPNRRSGVFFTKHLHELSEETIWLPEIFTINEFIQEQSNLILADRIQLLAELYKTFQAVSKSQESFDDFYFWGEIMLNDFNDVDKYLIEPQAIFMNLKNLKNIDSGFDYLTKEQVDVLKRFFKEFDQENNSKLKENFLEIWNFLLPVYVEFNNRLTKKGLAYEGLLYKDAVSRVVNDDFNEAGIKYFFVGFNAITACEEKIFENLKRTGNANFFWDYDDYYVDNKVFEAGYFLRNHLINFPSPPEFKLETNNLSKKKRIKVVSTPTNDGQVYYAGRFLQNNPQSDYSNTALVLADETMLFSAINYLPKNVTDINITMGYPVKDTLVGSFIEMLIALQMGKGKQEDVFYYKQILPLLRHPYIASIEGEEAKLLLERISKENLINVSTEHFGASELFIKLFTRTKDFNEFSEYLSSILYFVQEKLVAFVEQDIFQLDFEQLYNVYLATNKLRNQIIEQEIEVSLPIYFKLLRKMIYGLRIPFEGEPVKGLQVMGFLETRNLDFDNLVLLSVNDSLLPSSNTSPSFIPYGLRRGVSLPTRELHDAMYAYYFYRILQRASNITMVYNSGASGMSTGEKSRFVHQLLYDNNFDIVEEFENNTIDLMVKKPVEIIKEGLVKDRLNEYLKIDSKKKLSPSGLVTYLTCALKFYYQNILRLRDDDELSESVDARLFGNIFHYAAEAIYKPYDKPGVKIESENIKSILASGNLIDDAISVAFNRTFMGGKANRKFSIKGKNLIVFDIIRKYLIKMLQLDIKETPFEIVGLEKNLYRQVSFYQNTNNYKITLGGQIDRLDRTAEGLRIIDYKTGGDNLRFKQVADVFESEKISDYKAVLQTMIYGYVCAEHYPKETKVIPGVYKVKDFFKSGFQYKINSKEADGFSESNFIKIEKEVNQGVQKLLSELFDFNKPFIQTENEKHCAYCTFKVMCGK